MMFGRALTSRDADVWQLAPPRTQQPGQIGRFTHLITGPGRGVSGLHAITDASRSVVLQ